jgi:uncharacterized protein YsxB (DUF464 family)
MIKATFNEKNGVLKMKIDGHSGFAKKGYDIVCSAASILTCTVNQIVEQAWNNGQLQDKPKIRLREGKGYIACKPTAEGYSHVREAFKFAEVGFILLAHNYPQNVDVTIFGMEDKTNDRSKT